MEDLDRLRDLEKRQREKRMTTLERRLKALEDDRDGARGELKKERREMKELSSRMQRLKGELRTMKEAEAEVMDLLGGGDERLGKLEKELQEIRMKEARMQEELEGAKATLRHVVGERDSGQLKQVLLKAVASLLWLARLIRRITDFTITHLVDRILDGTGVSMVIILGLVLMFLRSGREGKEVVS